MRFLVRFVAGSLPWLVAACGGGDGSSFLPTTSVTINASPLTVGSGSASMLTWSSTNATSCAASGGWSGALAANGSQSTGAVEANTVYSLTCMGAGGTSTVASVTVNVTPTSALTADPPSVPVGGSTTLTWTSKNAASCTASGGWSGTLATAGTRSAVVSSNTIYSLSCSGPGGTSSVASAAVNVTPSLILSANPIAAAPGSASVLSWSAANATACTASGGWSGAKSTSGTASTGILSTSTSYSLVCTGPGGTSAPATVTVLSGNVGISPALAPLTLSQQQQFTASVPGGGAASWQVDGIAGGNSAVGVISSSGLYVPGTSTGSHTITAVDASHPMLTGAATAAITDLAGVFTYHDDLARDGANVQENALTPRSVSGGNFGKSFSCTVDGAIYAQPLWSANLTVNGAFHNVVIVATQHDSLYAFDADAAPCVPLWSVSLIDTAHGGGSGETSVPSGAAGYLVGRGAADVSPEIGVTGTPVIDPATGTIYVVSKSVDSSHTTFYQRLHAVEITTGSEKPGSPVSIAGTFPGSGDGGVEVTFDPRAENQRAGLALINGVVYVAWAAHEDAPPWYGWVMGYIYDGAAFSQSAILNVTPDAQQGGVWMGGGAPASDSSSDLYLVTGNGAFDATNSNAPNTDYGESLLRLNDVLHISQYFVPSDMAADNNGDLDFGAGGAAVLADLPTGSPVARLLVCGGKDSNIYVLNRDVLGGMGDAGAVQVIAFGNRIFATGAFWNAKYYLAGDGGPLTAFALDAAVPQFTLAGTSSHQYGAKGSTPSISAAGTANGIAWTLDNGLYCTGSATGCGPTVLYAHDASNLATELWNSAAAAGDTAGYAIKFTVPTVANGKVYVGTRGNNTGGPPGSTSSAGELDVYGFKSN